jgi:hypothetical protein
MSFRRVDQVCREEEWRHQHASTLSNVRAILAKFSLKLITAWGVDFMAANNAKPDPAEPVRILALPEDVPHISI